MKWRSTALDRGANRHRIGTGSTHWLCLVLLLPACLQATSPASEPSSGQPSPNSGPNFEGTPVASEEARAVAQDASLPAAEVATSCTVREDCTIVPKGCCAACQPSLASVVAVPVSQREAARAEYCAPGTACGACPAFPGETPQYEPRIEADCVDGECVAVDITQTEQTRCSADHECRAEFLGCCPTCPGTLLNWFAIADGYDPPSPTCVALPCEVLSCPPGIDAEAFCGADGHCDLRVVDASAGSVPAP